MVDATTFKNICTLIVCMEAIGIFGLGIIALWALIVDRRW